MKAAGVGDVLEETVPSVGLGSTFRNYPVIPWYFPPRVGGGGVLVGRGETRRGGRPF